MSPAFLTGLDMLKQMQALTGCCGTQPPVVVYRDRPGQSQPAAAVPDGWVLVPRLPTLDMSVAFAEAFYSQRRAIDDDQIGDWWAAMLAAAPQAPQQAEPWRPIETAPKDAVVLLAAEFDCPGDWRIKCGTWIPDEKAWRVWGASWIPTRWMPLPAPPATPVA